VAKYYESNFWIKFKSLGMTLWISTVVAVSINSFRSYTQRQEAMDHWTSRFFLMLELVDQAKDLIFLYSKRHSFWMSLAFSQTMILPFILNFWKTNVVQFRKDGQPIKVAELKLLIKTFFTHFGCERRDGETDVDYAQRRYLAGKNIKWIENILQMILILYETFTHDDTINFLAMFNVMFGLVMSTLTFAEHAGHKFAAEYPYLYKAQIATNEDGLTEHEKECQKYIRDYVVAKVIEQIDPQEWRQINQKGGLDKYLQKQINSVLFKNATDEKQLKKLLSIQNYEAFTLPQRI